MSDNLPAIRHPEKFINLKLFYKLNIYCYIVNILNNIVC
jgi:hypothetical protein